MPASRPAFHYALLASIALHALLLFAFPDWVDTARRVVELPAPLIARLLQPEPAPPAPPEEEQRPAPAPEKKTARPKLAPRTEPAAAPTPAAAAASPEPLPVPAPPPPPLAAAAPKVEDTTPQTADQYRVQLIEAARLIKDRTRYPPQAWENHWEGDVVLAISLRPDGKHSVVVKRSSRHEVLDQQAVQILGQALREVPLPPPLRGKDIALRDVTVQYRQRD